jgi:hypothetical protein
MVYVKVFPLGGTITTKAGETPKTPNVLFGFDYVNRQTALTFHQKKKKKKKKSMDIVISK